MKIPLEKVVTETDAPFLAPRDSSWKLKYNTPKGVVTVYTKLAEVYGMELENIKQIIYENALSI